MGWIACYSESFGVETSVRDAIEKPRFVVIASKDRFLESLEGGKK